MAMRGVASSSNDGQEHIDYKNLLLLWLFRHRLCRAAGLAARPHRRKLPSRLAAVATQQEAMMTHPTDPFDFFAAWFAEAAASEVNSPTR